MCWNELLTTDGAAACRFYAGMFGWRDQPKDIGPMGTYHVQMLGSKQAGGIMKNPQPGAPPYWIPYFLTPDLDAGAAKASALGATLCVPPTPIPGIGRFAYLTDPVGAMFALFQPL